MKTTALSIAITVVLIGGAIMLVRGNKDSDNTRSQSANNVSVVGSKQVIEINAKGGYAPRITTAKADTPTVIKLTTNGTFDCSSAVRIPGLGYHSNLPPSGETFVEVPPQKVGTTVQGLCAMAMYNFTVNFK
ncbi:MAG: cupredoxin domain-containing protein [bacterium]|nr:cupredoxin domain-containing protein [bacterium]